MNHYRRTLYAVLAFGTLMLGIALGLGNLDLTEENRVFTHISQVYGTWKTRTLVADRQDGAYSGTLTFGPGYYEVTNDIVAQPIRIDGVHYRLENGTLLFWVEGNRDHPSRVQLLSRERALAGFAGASTTQLYLYR